MPYPTGMKSIKLTSLTRRSTLTSLITCSLASTTLCHAQKKVDTELLLLMDVSGSVSTSEYKLMMDGYANAFQSPSVLENIRSGENGSIAVSLAFWFGAGKQKMGIDWMMISDKDSAYSFAEAVKKLSPVYAGFTSKDPDSGIKYDKELFDSEVGEIKTVFEDQDRVIDVEGDGENNPSSWKGADLAEAVRFARESSQAEGEDKINGLPIGLGKGELVAYYKKNVKGDSSAVTMNFVKQPTEEIDDKQKELETKLAHGISAAAVESIACANPGLNAVPEPKSAMMIIVGSLVVLYRRRKP